RAAGVPGRPGARRPRTARRAASSAVVPELELEPELLGPQERDYLLELVLGRRLHPDLLALDRGLRLLELLVLDRLDDRLGLLLRDPLSQLDLAPYCVVRRRRVGPQLEVLLRYAALDDLLLQHVEQRLHLEIVVGDEREGDGRAVERDRALRALEVVTLGHLLRGLIHGVVDFLEIGASGDVEGRKTSHGAGI